MSGRSSLYASISLSMGSRKRNGIGLGLVDDALDHRPLVLRKALCEAVVQRRLLVLQICVVWNGQGLAPYLLQLRSCKTNRREKGGR